MTEPPVCVPIANGTMKSATAAADPLEETPAVRAMSCGFLTPIAIGLANSVVVVLPRITAPARRSAATHAESLPGGALYLDDDKAIAEYMTAVLETNEPDLLLLALSDVARAKGMAQVAKDAGLGRESLYKALAPGAKPRFETVMKVARALGVKFTAHPA